MLLVVGKGLQMSTISHRLAAHGSAALSHKAWTMQLTHWPFASFVIVLAVGFESQKQLNDKQRTGSEICEIKLNKSFNMHTYS